MYIKSRTIFPYTSVYIHRNRNIKSIIVVGESKRGNIQLDNFFGRDLLRKIFLSSFSAVACFAFASISFHSFGQTSTLAISNHPIQVLSILTETSERTMN